jgi:hypothetical protein
VPDSEQSRTSLDLNWFNDWLGVSARGSYSEASGWNVGLTAQTGLAFLPGESLPAMQRGRATSTGALQVRVFGDLNYNSVWDDGEPLYPDVIVESMQSRKKVSTNENGIAFMNQLSTSRATDIEIDNESLPDFMMQAGIQSFSVMPRAGFVDMLDVPIIKTGEIDGTARVVLTNGVETTLNYVDVHLINHLGEIEQTVQSEFDGYFLFNHVLPGKKTIQIDETQLATLDYVQPNPTTVNVSLGSDIYSGRDVAANQQQIEKGYFASLGGFGSAQYMQAYLALLERRTTNSIYDYALFTVSGQQLESQQDDKTYVGLLHSQSEGNAEYVCNQLIAQDIACEVKAYRISL